MRLKCLILEKRPESLIIRFPDDKTEQRFELFIAEHWPWLQVGETWELSVKFRSIVMKDVEGTETFDTQLYCDKYYKKN